MRLIVIHFFCWIWLCQAIIIQLGPIVKLPNLGLLRGTRSKSLFRRKFYAFKGIPYAQPPFGELRFRDPLPVKPWSGILSATRYGSPCVQVDCAINPTITGNEDCLVLNVFTPKVVTSATDTLLPVMVFIHGGGFTMGHGGSQSLINLSPDYILNRNVVLVTFNYRLGIFGFLSTEDAEAPGNYGLLDQSLALKWVRDNIRYFGGNPDSVTIFGPSAGGASVEYQMLSPHSKGLFHKAIAQSGSTRCPWALQRTVGEYTKILARDLNCPTSNSQQLLKCLRSKRAKQIIMQKKKTVLRFALCLYPVAFGPRIDKERNFPFLSDEPEQLIILGQFNSVPFISGLTENEGGLFGATLNEFPGLNLLEFIKDPIKSIRYTLGMEFHPDGYEIAKKAHYQYFISNEKNNNQIATQYAQLTSDFSFFKSIDESVKLWSKYSAHSTYYYQYCYRHKLNPADLLGIPFFQVDFGVVHGDELLLLFGNPISKMKNPSDLKVSYMLLDLWTSFARDGVPKSNLISGNWLPITEGQPRYLYINDQNSKLVNDSMPFESDLNFWYQLLGSSSIVSARKEL